MPIAPHMTQISWVKTNLSLAEQSTRRFSTPGSSSDLLNEESACGLWNEINRMDINTTTESKIKLRPIHKLKVRVKQQRQGTDHSYPSSTMRIRGDVSSTHTFMVRTGTTLP
jgi:hypothetical protein